MRHRLVAAGIAGIAVLVVAPVALVSATRADAPRPMLTDVRLGVRSQQFDLTPTGVFVAVVDVPDSIGPEQIATSTLAVTAYNRLTDRAAVTAAVQGALPRSLDTVDLPTALLPSTSDGGLQVVVPIETTTRTRDLLQLPRAGLYPVTIEVIVDGEVLADVLTFVHRLPDDRVDPDTELPVALVARTVEPLRLDDDADVVVDDAAVAELDRLADLLDTSPAPLTFGVEPSLLDTLTRIGGDTDAEGGESSIDRLRTAIDDDVLLAAPAWPLDPSAAAAVGLSARYTQWVRQGDDMLTVLADEPPSRSAAIVDSAVSAAGARVIRDLGARIVVMTRAAVDALPSPGDLPDDPTLLVGLDLGDGVTLPATIVDREIAEIIESGTEPSLTAIYVATHLLAMREAIVVDGGDPSRRGVSIGASDLSIPDADVLAAIGQLLDSTDGLAATTVDELAVGADVATEDGAPVAVQLATTVDHGLGRRTAVVDGLTFDIDTTSTMLPSGSARVADWNRLLDLLATEALDDDQVAAIADGLTTELAGFRDAVQLPAGFSFTLTGRGSEVPIKLGNDSTVPLTVVVRLSSTKLRFPAGSQTVTLEPGQFTEVRVPIEARANGTFPVTLEVLTPDGARALAPPVGLTATVNAISGLGNLITGALALVLLSWWLRNARRQRRQRAASAAARRHPLSGADREQGREPGREPGTEHAGEPGHEPSVAPDDADPTAPTSPRRPTSLPDS